MKTTSIAVTLSLLFGFALLFYSCVEDEDGYSEYVQQYLDELAIADTIPVDLDVPCSTPDNMILYYTYDHEFTETNCNDMGDNGFEVKAYNSDDDIYLYLTFKDRPVPGKYATDYFYGNAPYNDDEVVMEYYTPSEDFLALDDDTVYVEKLSGGMYVFSFCNVQIDAGWGGYYASGMFEMELINCD